MPFLRVFRDRRGYETTYLMHWFRDGARQRSRILYVFRSPGGVRVGRDPLEPDVRRELERQHPDIPFDWAAMREHQQVVDASAEPRRRRPPRVEPPPEIQESGAEVRTAESVRFQVPPTLQGTTPDEQIAFLQDWYPRIRERILERTPDPGRREALLALAERLNPATWGDADQIAAGLQQAAEALERLSHVFARRRRRTRKRPAHVPPAEAPAPPTDS